MPQQAQVAQSPQRRAALEMLTEERDQLQEQVRVFSNRRDVLYAQLNRTNEGPARAELQSRMSEIDARLARLDDQVARLNDRIVQLMGQTGGDAPVVVGTPRVQIPEIRIPPINVSRGRPDLREVGGIMAAEAVALALIGLAFWRFGMRRMRQQFERLFVDQRNRLNQLQQAVDTVAIEVERISEGQRYVAKVLSEGSPTSTLPQGRKEPSRQG